MSPVWHGKRRRRPTRGEQRSTDSQNDRLWNGGGGSRAGLAPSHPLPMSALRPTATELVRRNELSRRANCDDPTHRSKKSQRYSITSSASDRNYSGILSPSALAVRKA